MNPQEQTDRAIKEMRMMAAYLLKKPDDKRPVYEIARNITDSGKNILQKRNYIAQIEEIIKQRDDSMRYARYLQDAVIPCKCKITKTFFQDAFLFQAPKEIVSGDFCWIEETDNIVFIAAADCTGHGVPGAMMTMLCSRVLTKTVKELGITEPGKILDKARELLLYIFSGADNHMQDGMDISLCAVNKQSLEVKWSGAFNPLLYFSNSEMHELDGDKQPVGSYEKQTPFTTHTIELAKGDTIYMFTDGYADQFGGANGKKLRYKHFKNILASIMLCDMKEQQEKLLETFNEWKGNLEQVDDVLVIGIRV